jgi:hypothetical protein
MRFIQASSDRDGRQCRRYHPQHAVMQAAQRSKYPQLPIAMAEIAEIF